MLAARVGMNEALGTAARNGEWETPNIKFEIRSTKHETNQNDRNPNDQNGKELNSLPSFRLGHWEIRILNLFRISIFDIRIYPTVVTQKEPDGRKNFGQS